MSDTPTPDDQANIEEFGEPDDARFGWDDEADFTITSPEDADPIQTYTSDDLDQIFAGMEGGDEPAA